MLRPEKFKNWINKARPGQVYTYFTGFLAVNRGTIIDIPEGKDTVQYLIPNGDIDELGRLAWQAFENGRVHLFQRKLRDNVYEYIAMKRYAGGPTW